MKKTIIVLTLLILTMLAVSGCSPGSKLQILGDNTKYLPMGKECSSNQECINYVNSQGGDGSPAICKLNECMYPAPDMRPSMEG